MKCKIEKYNECEAVKYGITIIQSLNDGLK